MKRNFIKTGCFLMCLLSANLVFAEETAQTEAKPLLSYPFILKKMEKQSFNYKLTLQKEDKDIYIAVFCPQPIEANIGDEVVILTEDRRFDDTDKITNPKNNSTSTIIDVLRTELF